MYSNFSIYSHKYQDDFHLPHIIYYFFDNLGLEE